MVWRRAAGRWRRRVQGPPPAHRSAKLEVVSTNERLTAAGTAIDWLERMAADWRLLDTVPIHERQRLHRVIAALSTANPAANRKRRKVARADRVRQEEAILNETGIRVRRRSVVTTPNVFPPPAEQARAAADAATSVDRVCYVVK